MCVRICVSLHCFHNIHAQTGGQQQYGQAQMYGIPQQQQYGGYAGFRQQNYQPAQVSRASDNQGQSQASRPANSQGQAQHAKVNIPAGALYNGRPINRYVCVCVCRGMHTDICTRRWAGTRTFTHVCVCECVCVRVRVCAHVRVRACSCM